MLAAVRQNRVALFLGVSACHPDIGQLIILETPFAVQLDVFTPSRSDYRAWAFAKSRSARAAPLLGRYADMLTQQSDIGLFVLSIDAHASPHIEVQHTQQKVRLVCRAHIVKLRGGQANLVSDP